MANRKSYPYRLLIHNVNVTDSIVKAQAAEELGDNVTVIEWRIEKEIHYRGLVAAAGVMP